MLVPTKPSLHSNTIRCHHKLEKNQNLVKKLNHFLGKFCYYGQSYKWRLKDMNSLLRHSGPIILSCLTGPTSLSMYNYFKCTQDSVSISSCLLQQEDFPETAPLFSPTSQATLITRLKDAHGQFIHIILLLILSLTLSSSSFTAVFTSLMYLERVMVSLLNLFPQHFNLISM